VASRVSIAVLPFVAMTASQDDEFFAGGLSEEILNVLAKIRIPSRAGGAEHLAHTDLLRARRRARQFRPAIRWAAPLWAGP